MMDLGGSQAAALHHTIFSDLENGLEQRNVEIIHFLQVFLALCLDLGMGK